MTDTAEAQAAAQRAIDFARGKLHAKAANLGLSPSQRRFLHRITAGGAGNGFLPMSHFEARLASSQAMIAALLAHSNELGNQNVEYFMGTFCPDAGVTPLQNPHISIAALKRKIDKAMRSHGLHGVYVVEVEILLRLEGEPGPRLMFHVHAVCWRRYRKILPRRLAKSMMASRAFSNNLGARGVVFTAMQPQTPSSVAGLAQYITKFPACVKQRRKLRSGRHKLVHEQSKYSGSMMMRMIEVLSHIPLYSAIGAVGEGKAVRRAWKIRMTAWRKSQPMNEVALTRERVRSDWKRSTLRARLKGKPCRIRI